MYLKKSRLKKLEKSIRLYQQHFFLGFLGGFIGLKFLLTNASDFNVIVGGFWFSFSFLGDIGF
jgi:hypothetical protein